MPVRIDDWGAAQSLSESLRLTASHTPDVDEVEAKKFLEKLNRREGHSIDYD
jgi:hypothetical protein